MAFTGKYVLETQENYGDFLKAVGLEVPEDVDHEDMITDIYQSDNFRLTKFLIDKTWSNTFHIGEESELKAIDGESFKTTVTLDGGKLKINFPKYVYTAELVDDKLVEVNTIGCVTNKMVSKKTD